MAEGTAKPPSAPKTGAKGNSKPVHLKKESRWEVYYPTGLHEDKEAIPVASFPMIVYFWPSLFAFLVCGTLQGLGWADPVTLGWWAYGFLTFNLIVIVQDLDQKKFVILLLGAIALALLGWVSNLKGFAFLAGLASFLGGIDVTFSTHAYFLLGVTMLVLFALGLFQPLFDYWRIEANEFVHYIQPFGRDQSIPRQDATVTRDVPDVLELFLTFGGGTLVIHREGQVVARIEHVPFLGRRMVAIERMLGVTRVKQIDD